MHNWITGGDSDCDYQCVVVYDTMSFGFLAQDSLVPFSVPLSVDSNSEPVSPDSVAIQIWWSLVGVSMTVSRIPDEQMMQRSVLFKLSGARHFLVPSASSAH